MNDKKSRNEELEAMIESVYIALREKGYDPSEQLAGYILSEDPVYIPNWNNARGIIRHIDRDELIHLIIQYYFDNKFGGASDAKDEKEKNNG